MKDFGQWFNDFGSTAPVAELPDGIYEINGEFYVTCCQCEKRVELHIGVSEIPQQGYKHYCGGSPRCCP